MSAVALANVGFFGTALRPSSVAIDDPFRRISSPARQNQDVIYDLIPTPVERIEPATDIVTNANRIMTPKWAVSLYVKNVRAAGDDRPKSTVNIYV